MYNNDKQLTALRAAFKKHLLIDLGFAVLSTSVFILLAMTVPEALSPALVATIAAAMILAVAEYFLERALYRKGKSGVLLYLGFLVLPVLLLNALTIAQSHRTAAVPVLPFVLSFMFIRSLLPTVSLLRDCGRLTEGHPCETVGRIKKNSRREDSATNRVSYLLFEDELTHEVCLLRTGSLSPRHRYRVLYLPHSGLAVGEAIPDEAEFDPFGNPIDTGYAPAEPATEAAEAPPPEARRRIDPNSHDRQRAARYAVCGRVCHIVSILLFVLTFVGAIAAQGDGNSAPAVFVLAILPLLACVLLGSFFKSQELKLRCTERTTAICVDTVRRRSGKYSHRYPIVEFEVDGVTYTAELTVSAPATR